jgi:hypothetical protein
MLFSLAITTSDDMVARRAASVSPSVSQTHPPSTDGDVTDEWQGRQRRGLTSKIGSLRGWTWPTFVFRNDYPAMRQFHQSIYRLPRLRNLIR